LVLFRSGHCVFSSCLWGLPLGPFPSPSHFFFLSPRTLPLQYAPMPPPRQLFPCSRLLLSGVRGKGDTTVAFLLKKPFFAINFGPPLGQAADMTSGATTRFFQNLPSRAACLSSVSFVCTIWMRCACTYLSTPSIPTLLYAGFNGP